MKLRLAAIAAALAMTGCASYNAQPYTTLADSQIAIKQASTESASGLCRPCCLYADLWDSPDAVVSARLACAGHPAIPVSMTHPLLRAGRSLACFHNDNQEIYP